MTLLDFINEYWTILAGIASFVFAVIYTKFQTEDNGKEINELKLKYTALDLRVDTLKDKLSETISLMQQDIREIMTILKQK